MKKIIFIGLAVIIPIIAIIFFGGFLDPQARAAVDTTPKSLSLISPNGGQQWQVGKTYNITWNASGVKYVNIYIHGSCMAGSCSNGHCTAPICIKNDCMPAPPLPKCMQYSCNSVFIAGQVPADTGTYSWTVPANESLFTDAKIVVEEDVSDPQNQTCLQDASDSVFSIVSASTTCISEGNTGISFNGDKCCAGLTSIANSWEIIANSSGNQSTRCIAPNDGSFVCTKCGDGICGAGENNCNCSQDCATTKSITVTSPNGGEGFYSGNSYDITWNSSGVKTVSIYLSEDTVYGGGVSISSACAPPLTSSSSYWSPCNEVIAKNISASLGKYSWTIPVSSNIVKGKIFIEADSILPRINDTSDGYFNVKPGVSCSGSEWLCSLTNQCAKKGEICCNGMMGGCIDEHGCNPTAGYSWCELKQKCLRTWEELCPECKTDSDCPQVVCFKAPCPQYKCLNEKCVQTVETCVEKNGSCCRGDFCNSSDVFCIEGSSPVFKGCDSNCLAQWTCEQKKHIFVVAPNGKEEWVSGKTYNITWKSEGIDKINIQLVNYENGFRCSPKSLIFGEDPSSLKCGPFYYTIASNVSASAGKYSWTVPEKLSSGKYKVRIETPLSGIYYDSYQASESEQQIVPFIKPVEYYSDESDQYFSVINSVSSCDQLCKAKGYVSGTCNIWAISPEGLKNAGCKAGYVNIGEASDCSLCSKVNSAIEKCIDGVGKTCCCQSEILPTPTPTPTASPSPSPTPTPISSCDWCGNLCVRKTSEQVCIFLAPPDGYECKEVDNQCQAIKKEITCKTFVTCAPGYTESDSGKKDSNKCPIIDCIPIYPDNSLVKFLDNPRVYLILKGKKLWIPSISAFNALKLDWSKIKQVAKTELDLYPDAKLIRAIGEPYVFIISSVGYKRHIPSESVFNSYGFKWSDIVEASLDLVKSYPDMVLAQLEGDYRVYKLEYNSQLGKVEKRWIKTSEAFERLGYDWPMISTINKTEFDFYPEGSPIE